MFVPLPTPSAFNASAKDVIIDVNDQVVAAFSTMKQSTPNILGSWAAALPHNISSANEKVDYLAMLVAIDYRHWSFDGALTEGAPVQQKNFYHVNRQGERVRGSQAMIERLKELAEDGTRWFDTGYLSSADSAELATRMMGVDESGAPLPIPDAEGRATTLRQIALALQEQGYKSFGNLLQTCGGRVFGKGSFIERLLALHPRYHDFGAFAGEQYPLLKLAQLTVIAIEAVEPAAFDRAEMQQLRVCPDYQVPKALVALGALQYSDRLQQRIRAKTLLPTGGSEEVEIRLATVIAAEELRQRSQCTVSEIDFVLWKVGRESTEPHHLCATQMY